MKVSDFVAEFLHVQGVQCVFEVVGGMITHLVDSIHNQGRVDLISMHHEQAAAFAADAMGRLSGVPGIAMATSGPGATNLLTGIGTSYFDSVPVVLITGQVNRDELRAGRSIRQLGFQETDIVSIARPLTKAAWQVRQKHEVPSVLEEAFRIALEGRPGPVLIDIPMDIQRDDLQEKLHIRAAGDLGSNDDSGTLTDLSRDLRRAQRPLILVGGGIHSGRALLLLRALVDRVRIPVVNSLMAVDALPYQHPMRVGLIGTYGNRWANLAIARSDFLLVLGSRLDIRQTGSDVAAFQADRRIFHVDVDVAEINNRLTNCVPIISNLESFLAKVSPILESEPMQERGEWITEIEALRRSWPDSMEQADLRGINPNSFMHELSKASRLASSYVVDVGNHQMWSAQSLELHDGQRFLTSGGMGSMGYALPAAIGASFARPNSPVLMIAGDGGMQLNIQELQTAAHHRLPIKMVVVNNRSLGMVRQFQQSYFDERYVSTYLGYSAPDFSRVARAFGIESITVSDADQIGPGLETMWRDLDAPFLLQLMIDRDVNAYPKIAFGRPIDAMEPLAMPIGAVGA